MRPKFDPRARKIPLGRAWQSSPVFLPGVSHGQTGLEGYRVAKCQPRLKQLSTHRINGIFKNIFLIGTICEKVKTRTCLINILSATQQHYCEIQTKNTVSAHYRVNQQPSINLGNNYKAK